MMKKFRVISVKTFVLEVILYWIIWFVYGYMWVNGFNFVSDILRTATFIGMLIIILSVILIAIRIRPDFKSDKSLSISKKRKILIVFVTFIIIHSIMYFSFSDMGCSTGGLMNIANKQIDDGKYYFYVTTLKDNQMVRIRCTNDVYEKLIIDKDVLYTFSYRRLYYIGDKGVLDVGIDITNIIDNRH